jgi:hypothetical protein
MIHEITRTVKVSETFLFLNQFRSTNTSETLNPPSARRTHWPELTLQFRNLMQTRVNFLFGADQLGERDFR